VTVSPTVAQAALSGCSGEVLTRNDGSKTCSLFTQTDFILSDYAADINRYYTSGPGLGELGNLATGPWWRTFFRHISGGTNFATEYSYLTFSNDGPITVLFTSLGTWANSPPLLANWTLDQIINRSYKVVDYMTMLGNFMIVSHNCGSNGQFLEYFVNEQQTALPNCGGQIFCPLATFQTAMNPITSSNYTIVCGNPPQVSIVGESTNANGRRSLYDEWAQEDLE